MTKTIQTSESVEIQGFLRDLGLSEKEANVYLSCLKLGNALVKDIAKHARQNRTTAYNLLLDLRKQGLVSSYQKRGLTHFSAVSPDRLRDTLDKRIAAQEQLKGQLDRLMPELKGVFHSQLQGSKIQMFEGIESLGSIFFELYRDARYPDEGLEITNWGGRQNMVPTSTRQELIKLVRERDIHVRSLLVADPLTESWKKQDGGKSQNKNIRLLKNTGWDFFAVIETCKNKIAIVTFRDDVDFQGLLIENRELASVFKLLFESLWAQTTA